MDSNHRSRETADLQSAPFGHSGTHPLAFACKVAKADCCAIIGRLAAPLFAKTKRFCETPFYSLEVDYGYFKDLTPFEPLVGLEPTTAGLQI